MNSEQITARIMREAADRKLPQFYEDDLLHKTEYRRVAGLWHPYCECGWQGGYWAAWVGAITEAFRHREDERTRDDDPKVEAHPVLGDL